MKRLLIFFAIIANILIITGCDKEKEEEEENNPLVGTKWYATSENAKFWKDWYREKNSDYSWDVVFEFTSDSTYISYFYARFFKKKGMLRYVDGKYKYLIDKIIIINNDADDDTYYFRTEKWLCTEKEGYPSKNASQLSKIEE